MLRITDHAHICAEYVHEKSTVGILTQVCPLLSVHVIQTKSNTLMVYLGDENGVYLGVVFKVL